MRGNRDLPRVPRLARLIRAGRFDVVHTHLYRACVYGRIAARLAGVPARRGHRALARRRRHRGPADAPPASGRSTWPPSGSGRATVAVSPTVARRLRGWGVPAERIERRSRTASTPAELALRPGAAPRRPRAPRHRRRTRCVVGGVGRLEPTKRFDVLVRAVAGLPGRDAAAGRRRPGARPRSRPWRRRPGRRRPGGVRRRAVRTPATLLCAMDVFASPSRAGDVRAGGARGAGGRPARAVRDAARRWTNCCRPRRRPAPVGSRADADALPRRAARPNWPDSARRRPAAGARRPSPHARHRPARRRRRTSSTADGPSRPAPADSSAKE